MKRKKEIPIPIKSEEWKKDFPLGSEYELLENLKRSLPWYSSIEVKPGVKGVVCGYDLRYEKVEFNFQLTEFFDFKTHIPYKSVSLLFRPVL